MLAWFDQFANPNAAVLQAKRILAQMTDSELSGGRITVVEPFDVASQQLKLAGRRHQS